MTTDQYINNVKDNHWPPFTKCLWQRDYHDYIIRNGISLNKIREYIINNPSTWDKDIENPARIDTIESELINVYQIDAPDFACGKTGELKC